MIGERGGDVSPRRDAARCCCDTLRCNYVVNLLLLIKGIFIERFRTSTYVIYSVFHLKFDN